MAKTWEVGMANKQKKNYFVTMIYIILFPKEQQKKGETKKEIMEKLKTYKKTNACWKIVA